MRKQLPFLFSAILAVSFACQKESKDQEIPETAGKPVKPLVKVATATIASVQMLKDCPDPKPAQPAKPTAPAKSAEQVPASPPVPADAPARMAPSESAPASMAPSDQAGGYVAPCQQSTIQIDFAGQGAEPASVTIKGVRLLSADGKELTSLKTRLPTMWDSTVYAPWDEVLQPETNTKVSYKLSPPDWSNVESMIGGRSHGKMFMLELTIDIGGQTQVVRSIEFARIQPEMVPT